MSTVRTVFASSVLIAISTCFVFAQEPINAKLLVGTWELTKGDGPPGSTVQFTADGKMAIGIDLKGKAISIKGTYTLKGDKLTSTLSFLGKTKSETGTIMKLTETEFHIKGENGKIDEHKRKKK